MFRYIAASILLTGCFTSSASSQESCAAINNDIARLACYDNQSPEATLEATLTPQEAFTAFDSFASKAYTLADFGSESLDFRFNDCELEGSHSSYVRAYNKEPRLKFEYFKLNLKHTTSIDSIFDSLFAQASQEQGHDIRVIDALIRAPEELPFPGNRSINIARSIQVPYIGIYEVVGGSSARTKSFRIITEKEDASEALSRLKALVAACRE